MQAKSITNILSMAMFAVILFGVQQLGSGAANIYTGGPCGNCATPIDAPATVCTSTPCSRTVTVPVMTGCQGNCASTTRCIDGTVNGTSETFINGYCDTTATSPHCSGGESQGVVTGVAISRAEAGTANSCIGEGN
jgi:hypothetical protein